MLLRHLLNSVVVATMRADARKHVAHRVGRSHYEEEYNKQVAGLLRKSSQLATRQPHASPTAFGSTTVESTEWQARKKRTTAGSILSHQEGAAPWTFPAPKAIVVTAWHYAQQITIETSKREARDARRMIAQADFWE